MRTGYEIRTGSLILACRFGRLDKRHAHPLELPLVEQAAYGRREASLPPRPAPKKAA